METSKLFIRNKRRKSSISEIVGAKKIENPNTNTQQNTIFEWVECGTFDNGFDKSYICNWTEIGNRQNCVYGEKKPQGPAM